MCSPAQEVFSTVELLEMILLGVDMQTLLVSCQRVNKTFKTTINGSRGLQKALWFMPDPDFKTELPARPAWMDSSGIVHWETPATPIDPRNPLILKFGQNIGVTSFRYQARDGRKRVERHSAVKDVSLSIEDSAADPVNKHRSWQKMVVFQGFEAKFNVSRADYKWPAPEAGPLQTSDRVKSARAKRQWNLRQDKMRKVDIAGLSEAPKLGEIAKCLEKTIDVILENAWYEQSCRKNLKPGTTGQSGWTDVLC